MTPIQAALLAALGAGLNAAVMLRFLRDVAALKRRVRALEQAASAAGRS